MDKSFWGFVGHLLAQRKSAVILLDSWFLFLPISDTYLSLSDKVFRVLQYATTV